jgi:hypothetical protein
VLNYRGEIFKLALADGAAEAFECFVTLRVEMHIQSLPCRECKIAWVTSKRSVFENTTFLEMLAELAVGWKIQIAIAAAERGGA